MTASADIDTTEPLLRVSNVSKSFGGLHALRDVSLNVPEGKVTGLIGPNGSGKSTLFEIISGFPCPDSSRIEFRGQKIDGLPPHRIGRLGLIRTFQLSEGGERLTVLENLLTAFSHLEEHRLLRTLMRLPRLLREERKNLDKAREVVELLGLDGVANEYTGNLSGDQRKLLDLGRVFMSGATLCLLDEPTAGVNPPLVNTILETLEHINRRRGISLFVVEHNMRVISALCDHVYVLHAGRLVAEGPPDVVQRDDKVLAIYLGRSRRALH